MAVHSQHPFNSVSMQNNLWNDNNVQFQQPLGPNPLDCYINPACPGILNGGSVFSEPQSELTCNDVSGNPKRSRDFHILETPITVQNLQSHKAAVMDNFVPGTTQSFMHEFTSLQDHSINGVKFQDLDANMSSQRLMLEDLIYPENQKLFVMLDMSRKKYFMSLLRLVEQKILKRLQEKEIELGKLMKVNMELEDEVQRMCVENQMWFNVAKNSEATVCSLRLSLEQILQQNAAGNQMVEGSGETDDARSTCNGDERIGMKLPMVCKFCGACEASFMVFPCRHLCLCERCEATVFSCPVCNTIKNGTLQVFLS